MPVPNNSDNNQLTKADYERAVSLRWSELNNKSVFNLQIQPHWFTDHSGFWFEHFDTLGKHYKKFLFDEKKTSSLFDAQRLAKALNKNDK